MMADRRAINRVAQPRSDIVATDGVAVFEKLGLHAHLTPQRSNGFRSTVERIQGDARSALAEAARRRRLFPPPPLLAEPHLLGRSVKVALIVSSPEMPLAVCGNAAPAAG